MTPGQAGLRMRSRLGSLVWWGWLRCLAVWASPGVAAVLTLDQAQGTVIVNGETFRHGVKLPYHWDRSNPGQRGEAIFDFEFELPEAPDEFWGIYLPGLGNAYQIWLNGTLLQKAA